MTVQTPTLPILTAVNALLNDARKLHPEIPSNIAIVLGQSGKMKKASFHGRFEPNSWTGDAEHEIVLSGQSLARGAEATLGTLLHEAAHAAAHAQGIQDTSRQGRYHNKRFKAIGESFGLELTEDSKIGWSITNLPESTAAQYAKNLPKLEEALKAYRVDKDETKKPTIAKTVKVGCECLNDSGNPLTVTVPISWFNQTYLVCQNCDSSLQPV